MEKQRAASRLYVADHPVRQEDVRRRRVEWQALMNTDPHLHDGLPPVEPRCKR